MALDQDAQPRRVEAQRVAHAVVMTAGRALPWTLVAVGIVIELGWGDRLEVDLALIAQAREAAPRVPDIGNAPRHAGREIAPGVADHDDHAAGHVFAAMIARALDDGGDTRIAHREAFTRDTLEIRLAGNRAVKHGVADNDVFGRLSACHGRLAHNKAPSRQALARVVIGVAKELQCHAVRQERAKALPGIAAERRPDRLLRQTGMAIAAPDLARQHCTDGAMDIADRALDAHGLALVESRLRLCDQLVVERFVEIVLLPLAIVDRYPGLGRLPG